MLTRNKVIAAVRTKEEIVKASFSDVKIIFDLSPNIMTIEEKLNQAHSEGKKYFIHIDLAEGIGKDRVGIRYLASCGVDGIISTKAQLIRIAKEQGLFTIQRFFALDSKGMESIGEMLGNTHPHVMEIMPGVILKAIRRFAHGSTPVIAGGLIQTKEEVTAALSAGATAVSTGAQELWYL